MLRSQLMRSKKWWRGLRRFSNLVVPSWDGCHQTEGLFSSFLDVYPSICHSVSHTDLPSYCLRIKRSWRGIPFSCSSVILRAGLLAGFCCVPLFVLGRIEHSLAGPFQRNVIQVIPVPFFCALRFWNFTDLLFSLLSSWKLHGASGDIRDFSSGGLGMGHLDNWKTTITRPKLSEFSSKLYS